MLILPPRSLPLNMCPSLSYGPACDPAIAVAVCCCAHEAMGGKVPFPARLWLYGGGILAEQQAAAAHIYRTQDFTAHNETPHTAGLASQTSYVWLHEHVGSSSGLQRAGTGTRVCGSRLSVQQVLVQPKGAWWKPTAHPMGHMV